MGEGVLSGGGQEWGWFIELKLGNPSATGDTKTYSKTYSESMVFQQPDGEVWTLSYKGSKDILESNLVKNCLMKAEDIYNDFFL